MVVACPVLKLCHGRIPSIDAPLIKNNLKNPKARIFLLFLFQQRDKRLPSHGLFALVDQVKALIDDFLAAE